MGSKRLLIKEVWSVVREIGIIARKDLCILKQVWVSIWCKWWRGRGRRRRSNWPRTLFSQDIRWSPRTHVVAELGSSLNSFGKIKLSLGAFELKCCFVICNGCILSSVKGTKPHSGCLFRITYLGCPFTPRSLSHPPIMPSPCIFCTNKLDRLSD